MTERTESPVTPVELERAAKVWAAAQRHQREALILLGYGYYSETPAQFDFQQLGTRSQEDIARGLAKLRALMQGAGT